MSLSDLTYKFREFWADFRKDKAGLVGIGILAVSLLVILFEPFVLTYKDANTHWRSIEYWEDNSMAAAPVWTNWFSSSKSSTTSILKNAKISEENTINYGRVKKYEFSYNYKYDTAPLDLIVRAKCSGMAFFNVEVTRPDGEEVFLGQYQKADVENINARFSTHTDAKASIRSFTQDRGANIQAGNAKPTDLLFAKLGRDMYRTKEALKGEYKIAILIPESISQNEKNVFSNPYVVVQGAVSGVLGTDTQKRDIFSGIIAGLKWALFIGLVASVFSVLIGVIYGVTSAYFGGFVDSCMSFIFEIFISIPLMPVLIVLFATSKPSIWYIILAEVVFGWVGPVKTIRSMAMQIREETYVEAAKALGAGHIRLIFKHITPILLPYSFASMAINVPGAILLEANLSLLGLGDSTIVTWGQILHDAQKAGASLNGLWWWIIPPGLFISIMGMTFAFIGFAMDKILHPKLKTR